MANVSPKTLQWLYNVLIKEYRDPNRAYSDLSQTLERFPTLSPRTDVYTFENGSSALLVHLLGTLPVSFRDMTYRFPMELWIPHTYPHEPPIAYITPTSDMVVRPGRYVSGEGRIYHPYLANWTAAWDRSSTVELLSLLCGVFSKEPPVMSRQQVVKPPMPSSRPPPLPPHPHERSREFHQGSTNSTTHVAPPPPPPKQQIELDRDVIPRSSPLGRYDAPPRLPDAAHPTFSQQSQATQAASQSSSSQPMPQRNTSLRQSITPAQFQQQNFAQPVPFQGGSHVQFSPSPAGSHPPPNLPGAEFSQAQAPYYRSSIQDEPQSQGLSHHQHQFQPAASQYPPNLQQNRGPNSQSQQGSIPPPQPKPPAVNLLDSPFDINLPVPSSANIPAPPIPPNPEKDALLSALSQSITQTLHTSITQTTASLPLLRSQNAALNTSLQTLNAELTQLQTLQTSLQSNISILHTSLRAADTCISAAHARAHRGDIPKIDDMLTAPTVVGRQLYDVVCDERAIEAAIWALQAALTRGRITAELWAKKTRELSREGWRRRVLARKIAGGMGLEV